MDVDAAEQAQPHHPLSLQPAQPMHQFGVWQLCFSSQQHSLRGSLGKDLCQLLLQDIGRHRLFTPIKAAM